MSDSAATGYLGRTLGARALLANGARVVALGRSARLLELEKTKMASGIRKRGQRRRPTRSICMTCPPGATFWTRSWPRKNQSMSLSTMLTNWVRRRDSTFQPDRWKMPSWNMASATSPAVLFRRGANGQSKDRRGHEKQGQRQYHQYFHHVRAGARPSPLLYEGTNFINPPGYSAAKAAMLALDALHRVVLGTAHGVRSQCHPARPVFERRGHRRK